jgi:prepilin-type N-terminal cleavage/methylation domain-containing protein
MNLLNAPRESGITLMELLVTAVILGILAAIGIPNLVGLLNKNRVQSSTDLLRSVLQDSQRQAMRAGKTCEVQLRKSSASQSYYDLIVARGDASKSPCLAALPAQYSKETVDKEEKALQTVKLPDGVRIATNITTNPPQLTFSIKGHISDLHTSVNNKEDLPSQSKDRKLPTFVIFPVNESTEKPYENSEKATRKCIIAGSLLGILRTGNYDDKGSLPSELKYEQCRPSLDGRQAP